MSKAAGNTGAATIELDYPIQIHGTEVRSFQMRRPKVKDQVLAGKMGGTDEEKEIRLFANLCEVTPENIEDLDVCDYKQIVEAYKGFFVKA